MFTGFGQNTQQQQQQQQPSQGSNLFGNASTTSAGMPNMFGNSQAQGAGGTSLFGGASSTPATGGMFGQPAQQQQQQGAGATGIGGSLIGGGGTSGTGTGGNFFGNTTSSGTTGGLFGNPQQQQGQATGAGSLFGGGAGMTGTGTSLFGNTANSSTTGSSFFGGQQSQGQGQGMTTGPSLFGQPQAQAGGGSLFGAPKPTGSLFGQPAQTGTSNGTGQGLFGQPAPQGQQQNGLGTSLFGQPQAQAPAQNSLFGGSTLGSSLLSASTLLPSSSVGSGLFSSRTTGNVSTPAQDPVGQFQQLLQRIEGVKNGWDPRSGQCRFQHYFYNLVDPGQVHLYGRPANATNEEMWQKAVRENPDPKCLVPVLAIGMDDLQQRVDAQTRQANEQQERLKELKTRIEALRQRHLIATAPRLQQAAVLQIQLSQRLLGLVQHLHLLIPTLRSSSIRPEEEALRAVLEDIEQDVRRAGHGGMGLGRLRARVNELWAVVGAVNATRERGGGVEWAVVDEDGLGRISEILGEEQAGLAHVTKVLQQALLDVGVIGE